VGYLIDKSITVMLRHGTEATCGWTVLSPRMHITPNNDLKEHWIAIETFGDDCTVYAQLKHIEKEVQ